MDSIDEIEIVKPIEISPRYIKIHCVNCGRLGHKFNDCTEPVISLGIIALYDGNKHNEYNDIVRLNKYHIDILDSINCKCNKRELKVKVLLVQRKHTMGYIDFVRCKFPNDEPEKSEVINTLMSEMTNEELNNIRTLSFDDIWDELWIDMPDTKSKNKIPYYVQDKDICKEKFNNLEKNQYLPKFIKSRWGYSEFELPKGRREVRENDLDCAKREFEEETGYTEEDYTIINDCKPLYEVFTGTNGVNYKHIYYVAKLNKNIHKPCIYKDNYFQKSEVNSIGLFTQKEALSILRDYDIEKKKIIKVAFKKFEQFKLLMGTN